MHGSTHQILFMLDAQGHIDVQIRCSSNGSAGTKDLDATWMSSFIMHDQTAPETKSHKRLHACRSMEQFWQERRHGTPPAVRGATAEGLAASGEGYADDLHTLVYDLKNIRINVEDVRTQQRKDTASLQGDVRRIAAEHGRHAARLDQVDDHQELHAEQVNH